MRRNKKKNLYVGLVILILMLGIGFAALNTTLKIDGTLNVARTSWDVHFENVQVTTGSVTASPAPTTDGETTTEMAYTINFTKPGDFYEFTVDMVNDGTIDTMIDVLDNNAYATAASTTPIALPSYLTSSVMYNSGVPIQQNQLLAHGTSEKIKVRIEFKKDISASDLPSSGDTTIVFKFRGDYKQADENAISILTTRWDGTSEAITPEGDIYKIYNPKQLAWVSEQVNSGNNSFEGKQLLLMNDINMGAFFDSEGNLLDSDSHSFTPIGSEAGYEFKGDFDGQNHTIYNLYISGTGNYNGLFGRCYGSELVNLTVANSYIKSTGLVVGIFGGTGGNYPEITINNVKSINNIIIARQEAAGIVGQIGSGGSITNCYSNSTVISTISSNASYSAGIVGYAINSNINNNVNEGTITCSGYGSGGIIGLSRMGNVLKDNVNTGMIVTDMFAAGGIVAIGFNTTIVEDNSNEGKIVAKTYGAGGIVGVTNEEIYLTNNINSGAVEGSENEINTSYGLGGIIGTIGFDTYIGKKTFIYNCHNKGNVKGGQNTGGIVGNLYSINQSYIAIKNVINEGTVEATNGYAGGIIGVYNSNASSSYVADFVTNAYNKGTVKGTYAAGLVGRNIGIKDSITLGTLQGTNNFGVIANAPAGVNITNVYYPNTYTSSYGTAIDPSTVTDTTLRNLLGNGFKVNNGTVQLYKANVTIENGEVTSCTYSSEVVE